MVDHFSINDIKNNQTNPKKKFKNQSKAPFISL